eukprot:3971577-Pyramimonas_sp.AAC.1
MAWSRRCTLPWPPRSGGTDYVSIRWRALHPAQALRDPPHATSRKRGEDIHCFTNNYPKKQKHQKNGEVVTSERIEKTAFGLRLDQGLTG